MKGTDDFPQVCSRCGTQHKMQARFCALCGLALGEPAPPRWTPEVLRSWASTAAIVVLLVGIVAVVGLRVAAAFRPEPQRVAPFGPEPLRVKRTELISYTPGGETVSLRCSRCRGFGSDPQYGRCQPCHGRGQILVRLQGRELQIQEDGPQPCARCNGTGFLPLALGGETGPKGNRMARMERCPVCDGIGRVK